MRRIRSTMVALHRLACLYRSRRKKTVTLIKSWAGFLLAILGFFVVWGMQSCPPGHGGNARKMSCHACPEGQFNKHPSNTGCSLCPDGTTTTSVGAALSCSECPVLANEQLLGMYEQAMMNDDSSAAVTSCRTPILPMPSMCAAQVYDSVQRTPCGG